ncbi:NAD-P-binding protein [Peniophora sp. CONT]|nr:NAD-P-binding protein [Peniophora sp. CONT]
MSGLKNFALAGVGRIGTFIADELLNAKAAGIVDSVVVLTRDPSTHAAKSLVERGATVKAISAYDDIVSVTAALMGADCVISTISGAATMLQPALATAAKEAGVRLFVPSEWAGVSAGKTSGIHAPKAALLGHLDKLELPYTIFWTGLFADFVWVPLLDLDLSSGKVILGGDGNAPVSFTARTDIARYVVHALTTSSFEELTGKTFRIEGSRHSFNEIVSLYEAKHPGSKVEVQYTPLTELKSRIEANPYDVKSTLQHDWALGEWAVGSDDNGKWPEWKPAPVTDFF